MRCKKHEWLFVKEISRDTELSREWKGTAKKYHEKAVEPDTRNPISAGVFTVYDDTTLIIQFTVEEGAQYPENWRETMKAECVGWEFNHPFIGKLSVKGGRCDVLVSH